MQKVGITGQSGFIGTHLYNTLKLYPSEFEPVSFRDDFFSDNHQLDQFVSSCDVIVHLAALNRHRNPDEIYDTNLLLVRKLIDALERTKSSAHVLFSSSTQEDRNNPYGMSKKKGRILLAEWAEKNNGGFTGLVIPNVFGPFGNPFYNSVIATFSHQLNRNETPKIEIDAELKLIYISELVNVFIEKIRNYTQPEIIREYLVSHTSNLSVTGILHHLVRYKFEYVEKGIIPALNSTFEINLFNTFRCYMDISNHFPVQYLQHTDNRGSFVELLRLNGGGQVSFSTTRPGITRGNHFHTRKIERFAVIKGNARIQLRRIGTPEVINLMLSGDKPAYVDMPVWYTHNITNTGTEELYTIFWINEFFNPEDPDTFIENV